MSFSNTTSLGYPDLEDVLPDDPLRTTVDSDRDIALREEASSLALDDVLIRSRADETYTPALPLNVSEAEVSPYRMLSTINALIQQNLKILLFTTPGEKIADKNFGVGLQTFLFENSTPAVLENIKQRIFSQINRYLSYLKVNVINVERSQENDNAINLSISYRAGADEHRVDFTNVTEGTIGSITSV
jgi:phage baseplate assembly protein W